MNLWTADKKSVTSTARREEQERHPIRVAPQFIQPIPSAYQAALRQCSKMAR